MTEKEKFIQHYVTVFLATHSAVIYDDVCFKGEHEKFDNQPVEDAYFIAEKAWIRKIELGYAKN